MAIITKPTIAKGQANEFDLSKSDLAAVSKVVNDSYFSDQTNWSKVAMEYESDTGEQIEMLIFDASQESPKANFEVSEKAKDSWQVKSVIIMDFDGGYLKLNRGDLTVENFDIALGSVGGSVGAIYTAFNYVTTLRPDQTNDFLDFGRNVAISGDYIVVSCEGNTTATSIVYVFKIGINDTVQLLQKLTPDGLGGNDFFGHRPGSIAIDGRYILVGAFKDSYIKSNSGAVYMYKIRENDTVDLLQKIKPTELQTDDQFGEAVTISGNYFAISATGDDGNGTTSNRNSGEIYLYKIGENDTIELLPQRLKSIYYSYNSYFGNYMAMSDNYLAVSNKNASSTSYKRVHIYKINENDVFERIGDVLPNDFESNDDFGYSVAISGNYIVVGSLGYDGLNNEKSDSGSAYVYKIGENDTITLLETLIPDELDPGDLFGYSVAISGDYIVVGAWGDDDLNNEKSNSGSAYVYKIGENDTITLLETLRPDELDDIDRFGYSVTISGDYIVVGAWADDGIDNPNLNTGAAYVFKGVE